MTYLILLCFTFLFYANIAIFFFFFLQTKGLDRASLIAQLVKNPHAMQETPVQFLGQEDLLEKG